jgi:hypothetical protein
LIDPTTVRPVTGGKCAQVGLRALEVLAEVEESGPERGTVRHRVDAGHVGVALQSAYENGELEVRLRNPRWIRTDARTLQDGLPFEQLPCAGSAIPGAAFGTVGFELEEITVERMVEPRQRGLRAIGRMPQRRVTRARRRGIGISARPALQQAAEGERRSFAGAELAHEPARCRPLRGVTFQHVCPAGLPCANSRHQCLNLYHDRKDHRPAVGSVIDHLSELIM